MPDVDPTDLARFVYSLAEQTGASPTDYRAVGDSLVSADLRGHHSHGVRLLASKYIPEVREGKIVPDATPFVTVDDGSTAIVDGQKAYGQVVGRVAIDTAISKATTHGIGIVGLKNTSHIGRIGEWAEIATENGLAFLGFVSHPDSAWVAPAGMREGKLSTNPICFGLPTYDALDFPLVLDMATSQVAVGKVMYYAACGEPLPEEWVLGPQGEFLRDAGQFTRGETPILPLGGLTAGYKGTGLAVMMELFSTTISDTAISGEADTVWGNAASFVTIDLTRFTTPERMAERVQAYANYLASGTQTHRSGSAAHGDTLLLPGGAEHELLQKRSEHGIPLPDVDLQNLHELAVAYDIEDSYPLLEDDPRTRQQE